MAYATCKTCGKEVYWRARRGCHLADLRCACGGELQGLTAGRKRPGVKRVRCVLCGKGRQIPGTGNLTTEAGTYAVTYGPWLNRKTITVVLPTGVPICWHHSAGSSVFVGDEPTGEATIAAISGSEGN